MKVEFLAIAISVLSLVVSWSVQHKQVKQQEAMLKLQERMVKLVEERDQAAKAAG